MSVVIRVRRGVMGKITFYIKCRKCLLNSGWLLLAVISNGHEVINWYQSTNIEQCIELEQHSGAINYTLFTIINPYIMSQSFLAKNKVKEAINYHNSFLPVYIGLNSITWAIFNDKRIHSVTWYIIMSGIDEGEILAQTAIDIDSAETAQSLNLMVS